jgi:hypothetical protein
MKHIAMTVVALLALFGLAIGGLALFSGPVGAKAPKIAPEPYQSAHAWAWSGTGTIPIPTGTRFVITDANLANNDIGCIVSGDFNGSPVLYSFFDTNSGLAIWSGTNFYLDSSSPATVACSTGITLTGYTVPLG